MLDINEILIKLGISTGIASFVICIVLAKQITKIKSNMRLLTLEITKLTVHIPGVKNEQYK